MQAERLHLSESLFLSMWRLILERFIYMAATLSCRRGIQGHFGVKPALRRLQAIACQSMDRQRPTALERFAIGRPARGLICRGYKSAHATQLPC